MCVVVMVVEVVQVDTTIIISLCQAFIWFRSCGTILIGTFISGGVGG